MNDFTIPELSDEAKRAWGAEIERLIRATGMTQDQLAGEIDENRRSTLVAEISRFKKGDDRTLARWFGQTGEHDDLDSFARLLGTTAEHLRGVLQRVVRGGTTESGWHPAFPMVNLDAVFISPKSRTDLKGVVKTLAERVQTTGQMGTCWLVGPVGSGRRTTARILVRGVREIIREKASEGASEDASAFAWRIVDEEGKVLAFEGAARPSLEFRLRCVENLRRDEVEAAASSRPDVRLDMDSWGASEMGQLIKRLAQVNAVRRSQRDRLSQFARVALAERYLLGPVRWPADVIHLMSIVAGGKVPKDGAETREMLIERAWRLAIERSGGKTLELLDDRFFERFCGHHVLGADVGRWLEMTEGQALAALDAALGDRPRGSAWQTSILQLIDEVATAPNKKKTAAVLSELRRGVATRESAVVLEQLIAGELLRRGEGDRLTFSDTPLAQTAAMRGCHLLGRDPFLGRWEALLTRDADLWIVEYALAGACPPSFMAALADVPDWAAFDACAARVVFAAASPVDLSARFVEEHVTPSWITLLHARRDAVEWCDHHDPRPETHKRIDEALRTVSERCRRDLPQIDSADTFESLASRIPSPARQFMKGWQSLFTRPDWLPGLGSLSLGLRRGLWDLAPWQLVWWHVNDRLGDLRPEHIQLIAGELVRLAEEGDERARRVLADPTSAPWSNQEKEVVLAFRDLEEPMRNGWCRLPLDVRLRWIGRADPDVEIWGFALLTLDERLRQEDEDEDAALDDAMNVLDRFDPEVVEAYLAGPFRHRGDGLRWSFPPARLSLRLAERRELPGVLREAVALRLTFLEGVSFGVWDWKVVVLSRLDPPCLPKVDTFIPILTELEELAHAASISLLALEDGAPLEARWRCRVPSELESRVLASLQRAENLASAWFSFRQLDVDSAPHDEIELFLQDAQACAFPEELVPVAGMGGLNGDKTVQRYMRDLRSANYAFDRVVMQWTVGEVMRALAEDFLDRHPSEEARRVLAAVFELGNRTWPIDDSPLINWLADAGRSLTPDSILLDLRMHHAIHAASLLVESGRDDILQEWLQLYWSDTSPLHMPPPLHDTAVLDRAWRLATSHTIRSRLLQYGMGQLRPWAVDALADSEIEQRRQGVRQLFLHKERPRAVAPLLRSLIKVAEGASRGDVEGDLAEVQRHHRRDQLGWACLLLLVDPDAAEIVPVIRWWAEHDSEPFSGDPFFQHDGGKWKSLEAGVGLWEGGWGVALNVLNDLCKKNPRSWKLAVKQLWTRFLEGKAERKGYASHQFPHEAFGLMGLRQSEDRLMVAIMRRVGLEDEVLHDLGLRKPFGRGEPAAFRLRFDVQIEEARSWMKREGVAGAVELLGETPWYWHLEAAVREFEGEEPLTSWVRETIGRSEPLEVPGVLWDYAAAHLPELYAEKLEELIRVGDVLTRARAVSEALWRVEGQAGRRLREIMLRAGM